MLSFVWAVPCPSIATVSGVGLKTSDWSAGNKSGVRRRWEGSTWEGRSLANHHARLRGKETGRWTETLGVPWIRQSLHERGSLTSCRDYS